MTLYQSERTRVYRVRLPAVAGSVAGSGAGLATGIRKEALGPTAMARTRHEHAILTRLANAGVAGVIPPTLAAAVEVDVHTLMFTDVGGR